AVATIAMLAFAAPAVALQAAGGTAIDNAVQGLGSKPVYVDPRSRHVLSSADANRLVQEIEKKNAGPTYTVVMPRSAAAALGAARSGSASGSSGGGRASGAGTWILRAALAAGAGGFALVRRRRKREELEQVKRVARDDLVALGDDIRALDVDVAMPNADPEA